MSDPNFRPKTIAMQEFEHKLGRDIVEVLQELYDRLGNQRAVAAELGLNESTVSRWMSHLNIRAHRQGHRPAEAVA